MQRRYWYAVRKSHEDPDTSYGTRDYHEAMRMLEEQGCGFITVIVNELGDLNYAEGEIEYEMFFGDNPLVKKGTREWKQTTKK